MSLATAMSLLPRHLKIRILALVGRDARLALKIPPGRLSGKPFSIISDIFKDFFIGKWTTDGEAVWLVLGDYYTIYFYNNPPEPDSYMSIEHKDGSVWEYEITSNLWVQEADQGD